MCAGDSFCRCHIDEPQKKPQASGRPGTEARELRAELVREIRSMPYFSSSIKNPLADKVNRLFQLFTDAALEAESNSLELRTHLNQCPDYARCPCGMTCTGECD